MPSSPLLLTKLMCQVEGSQQSLSSWRNNVCGNKFWIESKLFRICLRSFAFPPPFWRYNVEMSYTIRGSLKSTFPTQKTLHHLVLCIESYDHCGGKCRGKVARESEKLFNNFPFSKLPLDPGGVEDLLLPTGGILFSFLLGSTSCLGLCGSGNVSH